MVWVCFVGNSRVLEILRLEYNHGRKATSLTTGFTEYNSIVRYNVHNGKVRGENV